MKALRNTVTHHTSIRWCREKKNPGRCCDVCGAKGTHLTEVAPSYFRGDDEKYVTCDEHTLVLLKTGQLAEVEMSTLTASLLIDDDPTEMRHRFNTIED